MSDEKFHFKNPNVMNLYITFMSSAIHGILASDQSGTIPNEVVIEQADEVARLGIEKFSSHLPESSPGEEQMGAGIVTPGNA